MGQDEEGGSRIPMVKIKIRKKVEDEEIIKSHCCKECNKSFSSGKALGGHMSSAHVQANKDVKRKTPAAAAAASEAAYACMLCHKSFNSKKSLFGHMRCHPEREWRGMEPPPDDVNDAAGGLGFNLKSWASSNKRGRGPLKDKEKESFIKMLKTDSGDCSSTSHKEKEKVSGNQDSDPSEELYNTAIQVLATVKRDKKALEQYLETSPEKYKCSACHQGHCSGHKKFVIDTSPPVTACKMTLISTNTTTKKKKKKKKEKSNNEQGKSNVADDGDGERADSSSAFTFSFDLNMAPEEEEEELEDVGGGGSSNHAHS